MTDSSTSPVPPKEIEEAMDALERTVRSLPAWRSPTIARARLRDAISADRERAVRDFATYLATQVSPWGGLQREKLQSFAAEFLASTEEASQ